MKKYDNYKDSGIEWIGEIPEHWNLKRLKYLVSLNDETLSEKTDEETLIEYIEIGDLKNGSVSSTEYYFVNAPSRARRIVRSGDVIVSTVRTYLKAIAQIADDKDGFIVSTGFAVLRPKAINSRFLGYYSHSPFFIDSTIANSVGVTYPAINASNILDFPIQIPTIEEQTTIANYLDRKTTEIDELIADKKRLLKLYEEEKTAIINQAVTKGIIPNVLMKDSGIEWLGEIPEHWQVLPIKYTLSTPITDGPHETPELLPDGIPFISAEAIKNDKIDFNKKRGFISREEHERFSLKYKPQIGDVYMIKSGATTGNLAIVETDIEFNIWSPLAAMRPNYDVLLSEFLFYFMKSKSFFSAIEIGWNYGTQQNIGMKVLENIRMVLPSIIEQKQIVEHIKVQLTLLNSQIEKINNLIALLTEYRTALISEAVTGKIKVI